jgi:OmpA-OmpF porin, OOP family
MEIVAVGMFPVMDKLSVIGKLGFANVEVDTPVGSDDKTELTYGVGVQYDFTRNLGARAQWQRYDTDNEVDLLSVGIVYRF